MTKGRKPKKRLRAFLRGDKEREILDYVLKNSGMDRTALAEKMLAEIEWGAKPPEVEVLLKKISGYRNRTPSPEDQPWHMGILNDVKGFPDFPRSPSGVAAIMGARRFTIRRSVTLTIRQAKWIARLCEVPRWLYPKYHFPRKDPEKERQDMAERVGGGDEEWVRLTREAILKGELLKPYESQELEEIRDEEERLVFILYWALRYALDEYATGVLGEAFVTTVLDAEMATEEGAVYGLADFDRGRMNYRDNAERLLRDLGPGGKITREWVREVANKRESRKEGK